jgi:hypothetical protein
VVIILLKTNIGKGKQNAPALYAVPRQSIKNLQNPE